MTDEEFGDETFLAVARQRISAAPVSCLVDFDEISAAMLMHDRIENPTPGQVAEYNGRAKGKGRLVSECVKDADCTFFPLEYAATVDYPIFENFDFKGRTFKRKANGTMNRGAVNPDGKEMQYIKIDGREA